MNQPLQVPIDKETITPKWLKTALADTYPHATFEALKRERIGEAYGFASRIFRVQWEDHGASRSVVVKLWNTDSKAETAEIRFYRTFTDVGVRIPTHLFSAVDDQAQTAVLILEDIKNGVQGDVLHKTDLARAQKITQSLATMHAKWLNHPQLINAAWPPNISLWEPESSWFHSRRTLFLNRFPDHLEGAARKLLGHIELAPPIANQRWLNAPQTLSLGDFHLDNILFEEQTEPVFLDWARPLIGPQALNLGNLLFTMTSFDHFDHLIDVYLTTFKQTSSHLLSRASLEKQLGGAFLRIFTQSTCGIARWQPTTSRMRNIQQNSIQQTNHLAEFWFTRDPILFSFLN